MKVALAPSADLSRFLSSILVDCLDMRAVWLIGHADVVPEPPARVHQFVIFANAPTLHKLQRSDHLHRADVQALVVFDGEQFENAWGPEQIWGSLARWAWRRDGADVAYYNESKWAQGGEAGTVVRIRRKAVLVWRSLAAPG